MDTIIYFYKSRGMKAPEPEPIGLKSYMLIRVGLDVRQEEWFGEKLGKTELSGKTGLPGGAEQLGNSGTEPRPAETGGDGEAAGGRRFLPGLPGRLCRRIRDAHHQKDKQRREEAMRIARERELERLAAEREERIRRTQKSIERLALTIREYAGEESRCFGVYEDGIRKALIGNGEAEEVTEGREVLPYLWKQCFELTEFRDYCGRFWVELLLSCARLPHFVILGTAPAVYELLEKYAAGMKSLKWILPEAECGEEFMEFVEDFYTEYGLAISVETMPDAGSFRKITEICAQPSNIIDFTEDARIVPAGAAKGSIWLDMRSVEEKHRRLERRSAGITYISLKEKWKCAQRRCNRPVLP